MSRKAWLNPRVKKLVKPHIVLSKSGKVSTTDSYLHDYPHALKPKKGEKRTKKEYEKKNLRPSKKHYNEEAERAKKELACRIGAA